MLQKVPHVYQFPPGYKKNWCGPAQVAGFGQAYGVSLTVFQAADRMGANGGLTNFDNINDTLGGVGVPMLYVPDITLEWCKEITKTRPVILLIDRRKILYNPLNYWAAHFIGLLGFKNGRAVFNDSLERTGPTTAPERQLEDAINSPSLWAKPSAEYPNGRTNYPRQATMPLKALAADPIDEIIRLLEMLR